MTEDQAKEKWCPFVRTQFYARDTRDNPAVNRPDSYLQCIGSSCMAWRETATYRDIPGMGDDQEPIMIPTGGYCGLAWKP